MKPVAKIAKEKCSITKHNSYIQKQTRVPLVFKIWYPKLFYATICLPFPSPWDDIEATNHVQQPQADKRKEEKGGLHEQIMEIRLIQAIRIVLISLVWRTFYPGGYVRRIFCKQQVKEWSILSSIWFDSYTRSENNFIKKKENFNVEHNDESSNI